MGQFLGTFNAMRVQDQQTPLHMMYSHHLPLLTSHQKQHGMQAEQRKNQPTPSTPSTRAARLLLTAEGCA